MIILRLSPGLANQMYEYAAGYALAKELNQELVLDIAECINSPFGYLLDNFNISNHKKILYNQVDIASESHENYGSSLQIFPDMVILVESIEQRELYSDKNNIIVYTDLEMSKELEKYPDIYMCGYFFNRNKYYKKYWNELIELFTLKQENEDVMQFRELIEGKVSVGVHIRRGDMLLAKWAAKMEDDYYRAAIECFRELYKDCIFCVFSDDIEFTKELLGTANDIHYVHFLGCDDASLNELMCLKLCNHRILSNSSTFGRIADDLNYGKDRHVIFRDADEITKGISFEIKKEKREIFLNNNDIKQFSDRFKTGYHNDQKQLHDEKKEKYTKFLKLVDDYNYQEALQLSYDIYFENRNKKEFIVKLLDCLIAIKAFEECAIELANLSITDVKKWSANIQKENKEYILGLYHKIVPVEKKHFVIVAREKNMPANRISGIINFAIPLAHIGYKTTIVYDPCLDSGKYYFEKNHLYNSRNIDLGCEHYEKKEIIKEGVVEFYNKIPEDEIIVISRDSSFMVREGCSKKVVFVTTDLSDSHDTEIGTIKSNSKCLDKEEKIADIVLTCNREKNQNNNKYVFYDNLLNYDKYITFNEPWKYGYNQRINKNVINMISKLCEKLKEI